MIVQGGEPVGRTGTDELPTHLDGPGKFKWLKAVLTHRFRAGTRLLLLVECPVGPAGAELSGRN
jgi:hypothetical protein